MVASSIAVEGAASLRLNPKNRPTSTKIRQIILDVFRERLDGALYQSDKASAMTKDIADTIKYKLEEHQYPRSKYMTQVVIGEHRGEGVRMGCRCMWDTETDCYASESYSNDSLFCVATVFSVYLY